MDYGVCSVTFGKLSLLIQSSVSPFAKLILVWFPWLKPSEMDLVFNPDGDASWGERLWPSCKYLTALWCCPCQMSALNNSDYTSHSLHSWRNRSMWHLDAAAALVSFSGISFEGALFVELKIVYWIFHTSLHQRPVSSISEIWCDVQAYRQV